MIMDAILSWFFENHNLLYKLLSLSLLTMICYPINLCNSFSSFLTVGEILPKSPGPLTIQNPAQP